MAMYHRDAKELKGEFEKEFGHLNARQLWLIVRFAKVARRSCRQNTAFNNFASAVFDYATFRQVEKVSPSGKTYLGLEVDVNETDEIG